MDRQHPLQIPVHQAMKAIRLSKSMWRPKPDHQ
jgi:hypothetical protein